MCHKTTARHTAPPSLSLRIRISPYPVLGALPVGLHAHVLDVLHRVADADGRRVQLPAFNREVDAASKLQTNNHPLKLTLSVTFTYLYTTPQLTTLTTNGQKAKYPNKEPGVKVCESA